MNKEIPNQMTTTETAEFLRNHNNYLVITHRRPDGDTLGCGGALVSGLREIGKTAYMLYNKEMTPRFEPYIRDYWAPEDFTPAEIITVDTASTELFPDNAKKYADNISLAIDHHMSNTGYAKRSCIDETLAAGGEGVYEILVALSGKINTESAACLYIALSTDTGCFAYANTTANTLKVAGLTVEAGAPLREINRIFFRTKTRGRLQLEGYLLNGLSFYHAGKVAVSKITREMLNNTGCFQDDIDDISSIPGSVEGVLVGVTIREFTESDGCKISVRSSPLVSSNELCALFGGGGHPMAAGFTSEKTTAEIEQQIVDAVLKFLPGNI